MLISAILFDFDGTLTKPHSIDFAGMRRELGCPSDHGILEFVEAINDPAKRGDAEAVLDRHEMAAAARAEPNESAEETVRELLGMGYPLAVLTRNTRRAVMRSLENFEALGAGDFATIVTRDEGIRPKPDPEGVERVAASIAVPVSELLCVGDYVYDVELARNAGCPCAYITNRTPRPGIDPDFLIERLDELISIVEQYGCRGTTKTQRH